MAINPGDSRLPLYREGNAQPIFRKQSPSQAIGLYILNRDIWSNLYEVYQRKQISGKETSELPECGAPPLPKAGKDYIPSHHGIIEGVVRVNPWLLPMGSYIYVEIAARYNYSRDNLDSFDCEVNEVTFKRRKQINPPKNYDKNPKKSLQTPPEDLNTYSIPIRKLYDKLGGPVSGKAMLDENLTSSGVLLGEANYSRTKNTFVPQTKATQSSGYPDHPFVTYNFPFRFDLNGGPDSVYMKRTPKLNPDNSKPPPNRLQLFYQAVFGFAHHESDSDPDSPSELSDSDDEFIPKIRQPGEPIVKRKNKPSKEKLKRQWEKDLFHPDAYPWRPRPKRAPKDGISWTIRAYATDLPSTNPKSSHTACMRVRKLSYVPRIIGIEHIDPPTSCLDYCLAVGPRAGTDAGVITLLAKLDKVVYAPGEPIVCDVKYHNSSARIISSILAEVHQCISTKACANRIWRSLICRRRITDLSLASGLPALPGKENQLVRITLYPWPTAKSVLKAIKEGHGPTKPSRKDSLEDAWAIRLPRIPGQEFALETPSRHEPVPPQHIQRRTLSSSSFSGLYEYLLSKGDELSIMKPMGEISIPKNIWEGNPHGKCRCLHEHRDPLQETRDSHMPPEEPYQIPIHGKDVYPEDEGIDEAMAKRNEFEPFCRQCWGHLNLAEYPVKVSYEVVIQACLLPQHCEDPLSAESAIRQSGLGSGLLIDPNGDILGIHGPRVVIPCILAHKNPYPEEKVPVANYHVDQRQDCEDHLIKEPKVHEPSLGRGFFTSKTYPIAPCLIPP